MYKLLAAAHAIEFSVGCHARWSNLVVKSYEFPFTSAAGPSAPVPLLSTKHCYIHKTIY
jgi:hypothetical protein